MSHLSVATVIEKNKIASNVAFVPLMEIDVVDPDSGNITETIRVARNTENVTFQGNEYTAASFDFDVRAESGAAPEIEVSIRDQTRAVQARMQEYGGGVGFVVRIMIVNTGNLAQPPEVQETFEVISASAKDYIAVFRLGAENPLTMRFPRRLQFRDRCPWKYKGAECGYTGPLPTCDFSLQGPNGCAAHNNANRFGGFPGIKRINQ